MNRTTYRILGGAMILLLVFITVSCSTKKNTFTRRVYHNLTAHYNVYWNGKEAMIQAEKELIAGIDDNYNMILPMYNYGTEQEAKTVTPLLDRSIEKGSKTILKHSMRFGGKEYVRWIDDAYMLIGKAYFYKQDYFSARRSFSFVMREYENNPVKYEAMLWLARTYIEMEQFEKSEPLLNLITSEMRDEQKIPAVVYRDLPFVGADNYIKQENYDYAVDYLYDAISSTGKKDMKTRARFILAQIFQADDNLDEASKLYAEVIRRNPPYEMAFQAKINMAGTYRSESGDSRTIIKYLTRMLRDDKNKEFLDQVYYALSEVAFADGHDSLGVEYLRLSVARSTTNNYQKSTSALELADIYFAIPEYEQSQAYYDTAVTFLPQDYPNYDEIKRKADKLSELVTNLQVIALEDSLQMLAFMSEDERNAIFDAIIEELIKEEERERQEQELAQNMATFNQGGPGAFPGQPVGGAKWYFYNPSTMANGFTEFVRKWGPRKLEDLWRLKNKQIITYEPDDLMTEELDSLMMAGDTLGIKALDPHNREYYLKDIPFTEAELAESDAAIADAFYNLGLLYAEGLNNTEKAIEAYEELLDRFPNNENKLKVYYQLYRLYLDLDNIEQSDYYKNLIINDFPDSDYAKIIQDPDYYRKMQESESALSELYTKTYEAFERDQYFTVIGNTDRALRLYGDTAELIPKFMYLRAISIGKVDVVDSLAVALKQIIVSYPNSDVKPLAQELLDIIAKDRPDLGGGASSVTKQTETVEEFPYTYEPNSNHLYLLIVKRQAVKLNAMKVKISDHNKKYFSIQDLMINSVLLDDNRYMITVGNFESADKAIDYFDMISGDPYVFSDLGSGNYSESIISMKNYPVFYKDKDDDKYQRFVDKEYFGN